MKYKTLLETAEQLLNDQPNQIAILANASAFIFQSFEQLNWAGFYLYNGKILTVGPFQGNVACAEIELGKGVCGEAAIRKETMIVDDVTKHENHIACDANSRSEIVVPIYIKDALYGVLDIDSPITSRFDQDTVDFFKEFVQLLIKQLTNHTL